MSLQSNVFNITKVRNGVDANSARMATNVDTIYKFVREKDDGSGDIYYVFSPDEVVIGALSIEGEKTFIDISSATIIVYFNDVELSSLLGIYYDDYLTVQDSTHWKFKISNLYNDFYTLNITPENKKYIDDFFTSEVNVIIGFDLIQGELRTYKELNIQIGTPLDAARFFNNVDGIYLAMANAGLKFDQSGVRIDDGNLEITKNGESVFYFDDDGQLNIKGGGEFSGKLQAATGEFSGTITAESGNIGGFEIGESSIQSHSKDLQLFSSYEISLDCGEIEQGTVRGDTYVNASSDYRIRTKGYISVLSSYNYIIKFNYNPVKYIYILGYASQSAGSYITSTGWVDATSAGYIYHVPAGVNYIRINFAKIEAVTGTEENKIVPSELKNLTIKGNESLINVRNINIGNGGYIDGSLKVGNLSLINPSLTEEDNTVLKLEVPGEDPYFKLTDEGYIVGQNWSIMKESGNNYVVARFGKLIAEDGEFSGTIYAHDGTFTGEITASVINAATINTVNFVTENTRAMGGSFIFKPSFEIVRINKYRANIDGIYGDPYFYVALNEEDMNYFSQGDVIALSDAYSESYYGLRFGTVSFVNNVNNTLGLNLCSGDFNFLSNDVYDLTNEFEEGGLGVTGEETTGMSAGSTTVIRIRTKDFIEVNSKDKILATRGFVQNVSVNWIYAWYYDINKVFIKNQPISESVVPDRAKFVRIAIASQNENTAISPTDVAFFYLANQSEIFKKVNTITLLGTANTDVLIGINSDNTSAGNILAPRALSMETFTNVSPSTQSSTGYIGYNLKLLLGDLSTLSQKNSLYKDISGYGLFADNVYLHGSLITASGNNSSFAGINTQKTTSFNYTKWAGPSARPGVDYPNEKIVFWGGSNSINASDIQKSPFIVTDKGSIFASRGEFKGAVIADSVITDAIIKTPVIYGTGGSPSLKIYDTLHDTSHAGIVFYREKIDDEANDIKTLALNSEGFYHYTSANQLSGSRFISFGEENSSVQFKGTSFTTDTTTFSNRLISDEVSGGVPAKIIIKGTGAAGSDGEIELNFNGNAVQVSNDGIWNSGGKVINDGEVIFRKDKDTNNIKLDYQIRNDFYCLYVN